MARNKLNGNKDGNGFDKNPQNINKKGRPKKLVGYINAELKKEGYTPVSLSNINDAAMQILNLPIVKIKEISSINSDYPFLYKLICKELLGKNAQNMLDKLLDRSFGKAQQKMELSGEVKQKTDLSELSTAELEKRAAAIRKMNNLK